jgi:putative hemolysin
MEGENQKQRFQPIDIREIVKGKNPKAAGKIPGFIYRWLTRILHLREINEFLAESGHLQGVDFVTEVIKFLNIKYEIKGIENVPTNGRYMFASNHPLGGLDGIILLKYLNDHFGNTRTLANDFLMNIKPLSEFFIPINKVGGQARESIKKVEELYTSGSQILMFPAGLCSRRIKGKIVDLEWQKHFISKSVQHKIDIVPVFFNGRNTNRFYILAKIRKALRIKLNIEMMFLSDEMFRHRNKTFSIYFGKPISYQTFDRSKSTSEWASELKHQTYLLAGNV